MFLGGFGELYGHLTDEELDLMDEGMEIKAWKDLIEELRENQSRIGE
ncbi:hypothetical protein [Paenibacillus xylanilyticus]|uniref:Uncharacterized protein n=1 Tax=Paenibacillus xylanilyticus TaxID=248903 RepID=A0A7Y6EUS9_9BACL|nr:hypothetical protein [Paenibacillus xylanilyticus]NUU75068.1 hypothetical protein [Paenibacillus xylanilyticus]